MTDIFSSMPAPGIIPQVEGNPAAAPQPQSIAVKDAIAIPAVKNTPADTVEISGKEEKPGLIKRFKGFVANIKKSFANCSEFVKGAIKGIHDAAIGGSLVYTGCSIINHLKAKSGESIVHPSNFRGAKQLPAKALAIGVAVAAFVGNIWNASLNATERKSQIDHRWIGTK